MCTRRRLSDMVYNNNFQLNYFDKLRPF
ncbi:protein of unknown function [Paraburkholderia kururiensis]